MENIEKIMSIYCLFDKETKVYDCFITSFDDKEASEYFLDNLSLIAKDLSSKGDKNNYNKFIERLKDSCVLKIASFDNESGSFENVRCVLVDYFTEDSLIEYYNSKDDLKNRFNKEVK